MVRLGRLREPENRLHHPLHLRLLGPPVAAHGDFDVRRRVLSALDAGDCGGDEDGAAGRSDRERGARIVADERLLERHGRRGVQGDEAAHAVEDRLQAQLRTLRGGGAPAAVADCPEASLAFVDDSVPARSRTRIDAENLHGQRLGTQSDEAGGSTLSPLPSARYQMEMSFSRGLYTGWLRGINNQNRVHGRFGKKRGVYLGEVKVPALHVAGWWDQEDFFGPMSIYELLEKKDAKGQN